MAELYQPFKKNRFVSTVHPALFLDQVRESGVVITSPRSAWSGEGVM